MLFVGCHNLKECDNRFVFKKYVSSILNVTFFLSVNKKIFCYRELNVSSTNYINREKSNKACNRPVIKEYVMWKFKYIHKYICLAFS